METPSGEGVDGSQDSLGLSWGFAAGCERSVRSLADSREVEVVKGQNFGLTWVRALTG